MEIYASEARKSEEGFPKYEAIGNNNYQVRVERRKSIKRFSAVYINRSENSKPKLL